MFSKEDDIEPDCSIDVDLDHTDSLRNKTRFFHYAPESKKVDVEFSIDFMEKNAS